MGLESTLGPSLFGADGHRRGGEEAHRRSVRGHGHQPADRHLGVEQRGRGARRIGLAAALVLLFFTHIFRYPFALAAVVGVAWLAARAGRLALQAVPMEALGVAVAAGDELAAAAAAVERLGDALIVAERAAAIAAADAAEARATAVRQAPPTPPHPTRD